MDSKVEVLFCLSNTVLRYLYTSTSTYTFGSEEAYLAEVGILFIDMPGYRIVEFSIFISPSTTSFDCHTLLARLTRRRRFATTICKHARNGRDTTQHASNDKKVEESTTAAHIIKTRTLFPSNSRSNSIPLVSLSANLLMGFVMSLRVEMGYIVIEPRREASGSHSRALRS